MSSKSGENLSEVVGRFIPACDAEALIEDIEDGSKIRPRRPMPD